MIGVMCALDGERDAIIALLKDIRSEDYLKYTFYFGNINGNEIVVSTSGAGKVNASIITSIMILKYHANVIINSGIAGGLKEEENPTDVVVGSTLTYHDWDVTLVDNIPKGFCNPFIIFNTDEQLSKKAVKACENAGIKCFYGPIVTGDQFVAERKTVEEIIKYYPEAYACDMESTAVLHTASAFNIPCCIIRTISDIAIKEGNHVDYYKVKAAACAATGIVFKELFKKEN